MKYVTRTLLFMLLVVSILLFSFLGVEWSYMNLLCGNSAAVDVSFSEEESFDAFLQWMKENNVAVKRIDKKQDGTTEIYTSSADLDGKSWIEAVVSIFHPIKIYSLSKPENIGFYSRYYISLVSTDQINSMAEQLRDEGVRCEFVSFTSAFTGLLSASWISRTRIVLFVVLFISLILVTIFSAISRRVRVLPNLVMSILCIVSVSLVVPSIQNAFIEVRNLNMCKDKKDVYRINMNYIGQDESLEKEIEIQHVAEKAYAKLTKDNKGFFMDADAIHMNDMMKYSAEQNGLIGINGEETHITVSPNYFIHNPIQTSDGELVESKIDFDENTINLLVPGKYIKHESDLVRQFAEYLVFNRFSVGERVYKNASNESWNPKEGTPVVNIIPIKDGQPFYTYSNKIRRNEKNCIIDPVAVVYTGNFHPSYVLNTSSRSLYFEYKDNGDVDEYLSEVAGMNGFLNAGSVYVEAKTSAKRQCFDAFIAVFCLIVNMLGYLFTCLLITDVGHENRIKTFELRIPDPKGTT